MIPSIFEYLPQHAGDLLVKVAESALREEAFPDVVPPDALPGTIERKPPHPYWVAAKQALPIGAGIGLGTFVGGMVPDLIERKVLGRPIPLSPALAGLISGTLSSLVTKHYAAANKERDAELERAKQEYQDYLERRARSSSNPSVQSPAIRT